MSIGLLLTRPQRRLFLLKRKKDERINTTETKNKKHRKPKKEQKAQLYIKSFF